MSGIAATVVADGLLLLGVAVITLGVLGLFRMPDAYTQMHAASKAVFLGVVALMASAAVTGESGIVLRAALAAILLLITTPVGAYAIGRAALRRGEPLETPGACDESGRARLGRRDHRLDGGVDDPST